MATEKNKHLNEMEIDDHDKSESSSSSSSDENDSPHPDAYAGNEEVQIDFMGRAPTDPDCYGIAQLLSRVFLKAHVNCKELADVIISQNYVGSVICQCDEDDGASEADDDLCEEGTIFGITTVINITSKKEVPSVAELRAYLLQRAENHATDSVLTHFREVLGNKDRPVGFIINERFINIPALISVPLLESLEKEMATAKGKGMPFSFVYFVMIVKFFRSKARKGKPVVDSYTNEEEEILCKNAVNSFEYSVVDESDMGVAGDWLEGDPTLTPFRKVILFDANNFPDVVKDVKKFVEGQ